METTPGPPASLRYKHPANPIHWIRELWSAREVIRTLAERELRARYKQTLLGFGWAIILPVVLMIVFTLFVRRVVSVDTGGAPYPLFSYLGLLPWTFFSSSLNQGANSLIVNSSLVNKVYRPREIFPLSSVLVAAVDTAIATTILGILFVVTGYAPKATSVWIPVLLVLQIAFTVGATFLLSSLVVYLRDLRHLIPLILQLGLFATPVAYPVELSGLAKNAYAFLNPLGPIINAYRSTILVGESPDWSQLRLAALSASLLLVVGYMLFKRLERGFADVA